MSNNKRQSEREREKVSNLVFTASQRERERETEREGAREISIQQLQHTDFTCQGLIWERALSLSPHYYYYYTHQQPLPKAIPSILLSFPLFCWINCHVLCTTVDMTIIMSTLFHTWTYIILPPRVDYFTLGLTLSSYSGRIISHLALHYPPTQGGLFHTWTYIILPLRADYFILGLTLSSHSGQIISHLDLHYPATLGGLFHTWTYIILPLRAGVYWNGLPGNILVPHLGSARRVQTSQVAVGWHQAPIHIWGLHNNLLRKKVSNFIVSSHCIQQYSFLSW